MNCTKVKQLLPICTLLTTANIEVASALDLLPYSTRTHTYSAWSTAARGDIRTVGMAGATVGLADTFISALDNPAGLAMTLNGADVNLSDNKIHDSYIQNFNSEIQTLNVGVAVNAFPWGFSLGYVSPFVEGQQYGLPSAPATPVNVTVTVRELHFSAARLLFDNRLSIGLSMILGQVEDQLDASSAGYSTAYHPYAIGGSIGATFQLVPHILLGLSYQLPMHYGINTAANPTPTLPGFFQSVDVPSRLGLGLGWIPNRFFRADFTTFMIGATPGAALVGNDNVLVGERIVFEPKVGASYNLIDFKELKTTIFAGIYYEVSRIQNTPNRIHGTGGIDVKPWIFNIGWGIDVSANYQNYLLGVGVDIVNLMEKLDLIPTPWRPAQAGFAPRLTTFSDEGLPRPLVKNWKPKQEGIDPIQVGLDIPKRVEEKAKEISQGVKAIGKGVAEALKPGPDKTKAKKPRKKRKNPIN